MVQRGQAVHGVVAGQRRRRGGAEGRQRPAIVGDLLRRQGSAADRVEDHVCHVAGVAGVGPVPPGHVHRVGVDLLHVDDVVAAGRDLQRSAVAAAEDQGLQPHFARRRQVRGVGDHVGDPAQPDRGGEVGVRRYQHRHGAESRERGDRDEGTGSGVHQHADPGALPHAHLDQAAHHVVDALIDCPVGVDASFEEQEFTVRRGVGLLGDDAAQRDSGVIVDLAEADQARQCAHGLHRQRADRLVGTVDGLGGAAGQRHREFGCFGDPVHDPRTHRDAGCIRGGRGVGHRRDVRRARVLTGQPPNPAGHRGPGEGGGFGTDHQTEVAGPDHHLVHLGLGRSPLDAAHRRGLADVVDLADERQHRAGDVAQRHQLPVDREAAGHHPVVRDELAQQF